MRSTAFILELWSLFPFQIWIINKMKNKMYYYRLKYVYKVVKISSSVSICNINEVFTLMHQ